MKWKLGILTSVLLAVLAVTAMAGDVVKIATKKVAPDDDATSRQTTSDAPRVPFVPTRLSEGILGGTATVIGNTAYDYGWNSGGPQHIVSYNGVTYMIYVFRPDATGTREIFYVSYDGTTFLSPQSVVPGATQSTYFSGVDVIRGGIADGFGVVAAGWAGAGNSYFGIEAGVGQGNFSTTLVSPDRDTQVLVLDENGNILFEDSAVRTDYKFWISPDFGTSWSVINSGIVASTTLPGAQGIGALEPSILLGANGNVVVATTLTGLGEIAPVGTTLPNDADSWGYFTSTDQGGTWTWTTIGVDGQECTPGYYNLFENFGQHAAVLDNNNMVHAVANGYSIRQNPDTTLSTIDVTYWDPVNGFKSLVSFDREWDIINDEVINRTFGAFSNGLGCSYPSIAISDDGQTILCTWTQPNFTETTIDTAANGRMWADMWYNVSGDGGATWNGAMPLTATTDRLETFGDLDNRLEPSANGYLARILYISDASPGQCPFDGACALEDVVYHEFEISGTGVKQDDGLLPDRFVLNQNYPNPFNPTTNISYGIPRNSFVSLKVYDILGREVATLVNQEQVAGSYVADFDATALANGTYYYKLQAGDFTQTRKMMIVK